mmetsp:Transcript_32093/g.70329  ORF Transcript_32093/g.70329 Transcript_32093/m.70329 type:complete len:220 (+) Transcript_32093:494-1153(+)
MISLLQGHPGLPLNLLDHSSFDAHDQAKLLSWYQHVRWNFCSGSWEQFLNDLWKATTDAVRRSSQSEDSVIGRRWWRVNLNLGSVRPQLLDIRPTLPDHQAGLVRGQQELQTIHALATLRPVCRRRWPWRGRRDRRRSALYELRRRRGMRPTRLSPRWKMQLPEIVSDLTGHDTICNSLPDSVHGHNDVVHRPADLQTPIAQICGIRHLLHVDLGSRAL